MTDPHSHGTRTDVRKLYDVAQMFDPDVAEHVQALTDILDEYASILAKSDGARRQLGDSPDPPLWPILRRLWDITSEAHADPDQDDAPRLIILSVSLARFTRNLVAAAPSNQERAFDNERAIRRLIYHYTSFNATQDPATFAATRMLSQALSNIVTGNDTLTQALWSTYLNLPEEQLVLPRLFASPDARTVSSAFVLVLNCIHDSLHRAELLTTSPRGPRICLTMLDRMASLFEAEESTEDGRAFDIGYEVFKRVIEAGFVADLYIRLAVHQEVITPHQTTLLKLVDSYLHGSRRAHELALSRRPGADRSSLFDVLTETFLALSSYTQNAIQHSLASGDPTPSRPGDDRVLPDVELPSDAPRPLQNLDLLLPKVCEALVLVTECLTTVALRAEEAATDAGRPRMSAAAEVDAGASVSEQLTPKELLVSATASSGQGLVESLVETLRLVDVFVPRITYGKVVKRPAPPGGEAPPDEGKRADDQQQGHEAVWGQTDGSGNPVEDAHKAQVAQAFAHVKRDLVRLLGILASQNRGVQDRVRACDGIPVVMNLCVVDDYNPYLREHAIFTLRNLLFENAENQAVVDAIKPVGRWDEAKVLRDIRGGV
ncbi:spinocerebellar ataxia type 10 protein domain-containing protein [Cubamyces lactineus]|nr:spinocerebellar ataxia type 10 protein domain-containing protein [Cubamyces lactineus]